MGFDPEGPFAKRNGASQLGAPRVACYHNTISDSYYNIISLATSNHCDFGSSLFEALRSAFCFSMAVSTCHIARSSSISSWGRSKACVIIFPFDWDSSIVSPPSGWASLGSVGF